MIGKWNIAFGHFTLFLLYALFSLISIPDNPGLLLVTSLLIYLLAGFWSGITSHDDQKFAFFPAFAFWTSVKIVELVIFEIKFMKFGIESAHNHTGLGNAFWNLLGNIYLIQYLIIISLFFLGYFATRGIRRNIQTSRRQMQQYQKSQETPLS
jgi:hypothetical protein